jgi:hypothetical protein
MGCAASTPPRGPANRLGRRESFESGSDVSSSTTSTSESLSNETKGICLLHDQKTVKRGSKSLTSQRRRLSSSLPPIDERKAQIEPTSESWRLDRSWRRSAIYSASVTSSTIVTPHVFYDANISSRFGTSSQRSRFSSRATRS